MRCVQAPTRGGIELPIDHLGRTGTRSRPAGRAGRCRRRRRRTARRRHAGRTATRRTVEARQERLTRHGRAIGAVARHRRVGIARCDHPRGKRDLLGCKPVAVPGSVPAFVRRPDDRPDTAKRRRPAEDPLADERVLLDELPLLVRERPRLLQDGVRNRELSHIVQLRSEAELLELVALDPEPTADGHRESRDALDVRAQARLPLGQRPQQSIRVRCSGPRSACPCARRDADPQGTAPSSDPPPRPAARPHRKRWRS